MGYLEDFQEQLDRNNFHKFFQLWEEYCSGEEVDSAEFTALLKAIKRSEMAPTFGPYAATALPLWEAIADSAASYEVLRLIVDLQTTNSPLLREIATTALQTRHGSEPDFLRRMRRVGLQEATGMAAGFQGAISYYELLTHLLKGNFVFHAGGWGAGEIMEVSPVREEVVIEFENVVGRKALSFLNAFKVLDPLQLDHFSVRRFAFPDELEQQAKENPVEVIRMLLRDLGPKTAAEIKDELVELVIPEADWVKWWQGARAKIKKDTLIETPSNLKDPFRLRQTAMSHEDLFRKKLSTKSDVREILQATYNFVRDMPDMLKKAEVKESLKEKLLELLDEETITPAQALQVHIFLEHYFGEKVQGKSVAEALIAEKNVEAVINDIEIIAFKKRALMTVHDSRSDWVQIFLALLFTVQQNALRDYILKELQQPETQARLEQRLRELLIHPTAHPDVFIWYFQKVVDGEAVPFSDKRGQWEFLEIFLILFSILETQPEHRDLIKKMYGMLSGNRYLMVRNILEGTSIEFIREFLLLVSKCRTLSEHDKKILNSLAEVVHPDLVDKRKSDVDQTDMIWTTEEGLRRTQERVRQLGTVEVVDNAREIEAARALGDLRENSEFKFALERRAHLQNELKVLSDQLHRARLIAPDDISSTEIGIGSKVELSDRNGKCVVYTILGPWEADADKGILSFQSKLAESMIGKKVGDVVEYKDSVLTVSKIASYLA